ncbi:SOS response-associated peptidase [Pukyongia salina]|uniref:Abasic site processing protein n=1 Tax=Pukyongia salina TaxID=2094025 RepID=A0A2S0HTG3_9FLAO|nr:SOS response-associated peptidase [Pukyongia salina]AVI49981.1 SOS response-associated peptidase [Pukyongia salina]
MCYDIKASLEAQLSKAKRRGDEHAMEEIRRKLIPYTDLPIHHASGFSHPKLLIYPDRSPDYPEIATWGLVPHWVKDKEQMRKYWNNTLNARGETIFEKPSFRDSAKNNRCLIYIDGFYEHHHYKGKTYPFFIHHKTEKPLALAGLWNEWVDKESGEVLNTFTIVTTEGNNMMGKIHNNPKLKGPRMPLILPEEMEEKWLVEIKDELDVKSVQAVIESYPENELEAYTVHRLRGKEYLGNVEETAKEFHYEELEF